MNDAACSVFQDLINLSVRMMPIFLCLEPKQKNRETIAACSVYLWVIMIFTQSLFHIPDRTFWIFQAIFSCLFFAPDLFPGLCGGKAVFLPVSLDAFQSFFVPEPLYSLVLPHIASIVRRTALHARLSAQCLALLPVRAFLDEKAGKGNLRESLSPLFPAVSCLSGAVSLHPADRRARPVSLRHSIRSEPESPSFLSHSLCQPAAALYADLKQHRTDRETQTD